MNNWQPTATIEVLKKRAELMINIRKFFQKKNILEVETPVSSATTIPDPNIVSLKTTLLGKTYYLQTSPEFHMKRLLAAGSGCIYQISKAFRDDEISRIHNPEFTMLEWYRLNFNAHELMLEIDEFLQTLLNTKPAIYFSYENIFLKFLNINPLQASIFELSEKAEEHNITVQGLNDACKDTWLNLLMSHCIEPKLNEENQPYFIYDFPISQAALAKQSKQDPRVAERFEVYLHGMELANGFHELTDAFEQKHRFENYLKARSTLGMEAVPIPDNFLAALRHGFPACAGVALGIDRLVMLYCRKTRIREVISFTAENS
jgi:lysyl-tRNA synthetase class 2